MLGLVAQEAEHIVALIASHGRSLILALDAKALASTLVLLIVKALGLLGLHESHYARIKLHIGFQHSAKKSELAIGLCEGEMGRATRSAPAPRRAA